MVCLCAARPTGTVEMTPSVVVRCRVVTFASKGWDEVSPAPGRGLTERSQKCALRSEWELSGSDDF